MFDKATAVFMSWDRVECLKKILPVVKSYPFIDEVIVWNNNSNYYLLLDDVKIINSSCDMGLWTRFAAASLAKNENILFHDDDLLVHPDDASNIYEKFCRNRKGNHGLFGREPGPHGEYNFKDVNGKVEIHLTRFVFSTRERATTALSYAPEFDKLKPKLRGNGEDIVLSYATRGWNYTYGDIEPEEIGVAGTAIHQRFDDHKAHRTNVTLKCWSLFGRPEKT